MFETYVIDFYQGDSHRLKSSEDLLILLREVNRFDSWRIFKCEIIEGLYYPVKIIARSSICGIK